MNIKNYIQNTVFSAYHRVLNGDMVRKSGGVALGSALGQGVQFVAIPALAKIYTPAEFGQWAFLLGILVVVLPILTLRYEMAIPLLKQEEVGVFVIGLVGVVLLMVVVLSFLGVGVLSLFPRLLILLENVFSAGVAFSFSSALWLGLIMAMLVEGITAVLTFVFIRQRDFSTLGKFYFVRGLGVAFAQVFLGVIGWGTVGLLGGWIAGQILGSFFLMRNQAIQEILSFENHFKDFRKMIEQIRRLFQEYRKFPFFMSPAGVLNTLGLRIPSLLLVFLYGSEATGLYAMATRLVDAPAGIVIGAVSQVYLGEMSHVARNTPDKILPMFKRITRYTGIIGLLLVPILIIISWLIRPLLGSEWALASLYVLALLPYLVAKMVVSPISLSSVIARRQDLQLLLDVVRVFLTTIVLVSSAVLGFSPVNAIVGYSLVMAFLYFISYYLYLYLVKNIKV